MSRSKFPAGLVCALVALSVVWVHAPRASAQAPSSLEKKKYRSMFDQDLIDRGLVDGDLVKDRRLRNTTKFLVQGICRGSKPLRTADVDNTATFDNYFKRYLFPLMTHPDELGNIAEIRQDLMKNYFGVIKNDIALQPVRDRLNSMTLAYMRGLAGTRLGEFHPAVRYNSMLIIGELDSRGPEIIGDPKPAEPLPEALEVLRAELGSKDQIDAVRVAALIGISRHAELDRHRPESKRIPNVTLRALGEELLEVAAAKEPPKGRSPDGHLWMRRQALEALSLLATTRPMGPVSDLADKIISDPNEPLAMRCAAAEAQGRMAAPLAEGVSAEEAAMKLVRLGGEILDAELSGLKPYMAKLKREEESKESSSSSGLGTTRFEGGGVDIFESSSSPSTTDTTTKVEQAPQIAAASRRARLRLSSIKSGIFGTDGGPGISAGIRDAAAKSKVENVEQLLEDTTSVLVDQAPVGDAPALAEVSPYYTSIDSQRRQFAEIAPAPAAKEPAADELGPATLPATLPGTTEEPAPAKAPAPSGLPLP